MAIRHKGNTEMIPFVIVPGKEVPIIELRTCKTLHLIQVVYAVEQHHKYYREMIP